MGRGIQRTDQFLSAVRGEVFAHERGRRDRHAKVLAVLQNLKRRKHQVSKAESRQAGMGLHASQVGQERKVSNLVRLGECLDHESVPRRDDLVVKVRTRTVKTETSRIGQLADDRRSIEAHAPLVSHSQQRPLAFHQLSLHLLLPVTTNISRLRLQVSLEGKRTSHKQGLTQVSSPNFLAASAAE